MAGLRIGTSGYQYDHWKGRFYPGDLGKKDWFEHYTQHFDTVEINNTFYHLPGASTFERWRDRAPCDFCYVLKFSRYGSHLKCLKNPQDTITRFMERASLLKSHLGPILVQLKPNWSMDAGRLRAFLQSAPKSQRWAVEFRDESWLCEEVFDILREFGAALCIHDMIENHPRVVTTDWVYLRFHGDHYEGSYSHQFLTAVAERVKGHLDAGRDVYAYFNNDQHAYAAENALQLRSYVQSARSAQ